MDGSLDPSLVLLRAVIACQAANDGTIRSSRGQLRHGRTMFRPTNELTRGMPSPDHRSGHLPAMIAASGALHLFRIARSQRTRGCRGQQDQDRDSIGATRCRPYSYVGNIAAGLSRLVIPIQQFSVFNLVYILFPLNLHCSAIIFNDTFRCTASKQQYSENIRRFYWLFLPNPPKTLSQCWQSQPSIRTVTRVPTPSVHSIEISPCNRLRTWL